HHGTPPYEPGFYRNLCVNSPYRDFLKEHIEEIFELLPVDGLFLDIVSPRECSCRHCREGMEAQGVDPSCEASRRQYGINVLNEFMQDMSSFIRNLDERCSIFYNGGHIGPRHRASADSFTHFELESLPSGGWGYMHFPLTVRYARGLGRECLGMTGKFHTSWGDFHSFKHPAALQFECFTMLAMNTKCSIGDQLHPRGKICEETYELIGSVYREVEEKEPWCREARPVTEIGVFSPEEFTGSQCPPSAVGAVRILQEGAHQFDLIDTRSDFSKYKVLILPDVITVSDDLADRIERFVAGSGALIASHHSGLNKEHNQFALKSLGIEFQGDAPYSPDFIVPKDPVAKGLKRTEYVMYLQGTHVKPVGQSTVIADVVEPYFNRTYRHFCSHRHTPSSGKVGYPGVIRNGNSIYFIHPIFAQYSKNAPYWCKQLFLNALNMLLPNPLLIVQAPSNTVATINEQASHNRWVLHLLNYIPERRGEDFDIIQDILPVYGIRVSVRVPTRIREVATAPQNEALEFEQNRERVEFTLPVLDGHQMISLTW
ncbi:MAG: beta-galactosidase trimerization domain-containing protein, partial [bacterium]